MIGVYTPVLHKALYDGAPIEDQLEAAAQIMNEELDKGLAEVPGIGTLQRRGGGVGAPPLSRRARGHWAGVLPYAGCDARRSTRLGYSWRRWC